MVKDYVLAAILDTGVPVETLSLEKKNVLKKTIQETLNVTIFASPPWDKIDAPEGKFRPNGWNQIAEYVGNAGCLMFLGEPESPVWKFRTGLDFQHVVTECPPFEFYVCDENGTYLICNNHHDYIVGWGLASQWISGL